MSTTAYDFSINRHQLNLPLVANATKWCARPAATKILGISLLAIAAPTSASGTALFTAGEGRRGQDNLLGSTNFGIETLTDGVRSEMTLTATTADLNLSEGDTVGSRSSRTTRTWSSPATTSGSSSRRWRADDAGP